MMVRSPYLVLLTTIGCAVVTAAPGPRCPVVEPLGIMQLPFHPAFLAAEDIEGEPSLFVTSFFNVAFNPGPGPPFFPFERDLVARINDIEELEENPSGYATVVPEVLTGQGIVWPNEATKAPDGVFPFEAIVIAQGFHPAPLPGRLTAININDSANNFTEYVIHQSTQTAAGYTGPFDPNNMPRYYHDAVFHDMDNDGYKDIISVRSGFRVGQNFYPPLSELVWFKNPGPDNLDPAVEWVETTLFGGPSANFAGPDIFVKIYDFDDDGVPEIVATHFFTGPPPTSADSGKITLYAAPEGSDWSQVDALNPAAPQARVKDLSVDQGKPFGIEIVDLNGDGRVDILCSNHQPDAVSFPSQVAGRVYALEQPSGEDGEDYFSGNWTTHVLLDDIRPNPSLAGAGSSRLAPGAASAIYPFQGKQRGNRKQRKLRPWIIVGGDEASKVWLLRPTSSKGSSKGKSNGASKRDLQGRFKGVRGKPRKKPRRKPHKRRPWKGAKKGKGSSKNDWEYDAQVIFDINEFYGPNTTQTPLTDPFGVTISTIGKVVATDSVEKNGDLILYIPVFEANDIHVFRLTSDCSATS